VPYDCGNGRHLRQARGELAIEAAIASQPGTVIISLQPEGNFQITGSSR